MEQHPTNSIGWIFHPDLKSSYHGTTIHPLRSSDSEHCWQFKLGYHLSSCHCWLQLCQCCLVADVAQSSTDCYKCYWPHSNDQENSTIIKKVSHLFNDLFRYFQYFKLILACNYLFECFKWKYISLNLLTTSKCHQIMEMSKMVTRAMTWSHWVPWQPVGDGTQLPVWSGHMRWDNQPHQSTEHQTLSWSLD